MVRGLIRVGLGEVSTRRVLCFGQLRFARRPFTIYGLVGTQRTSGFAVYFLTSVGGVSLVFYENEQG